MRKARALAQGGHEWSPAEALDHHERVDPHHRESALSDIVLGSQDGLVNVLGVVLGIVAASQDVRIVLAAGFATAAAESVSMAAVAYTSRLAAGHLYRSEWAREHRHVRAVPELEREEIRTLYRAKGFDGDLLERIVETVTRDPDVWVALMMAEEHKIAPVSRKSALRSAFVVGVSALVGSLLPVLPFVALGLRAGTFASIGVAVASLFGLGFYEGRMTGARALWTGLEIAAIGSVSALVGFAVGAMFSIGP